MRVLNDALVSRLLTDELALRAVEDGFASILSGRAGQSTPRALFGEIDGDRRLQAKAAWLLPAGLGGFRLVGELGGRYVDSGRLMVLYSLATMDLAAVVEERSIYRARVAAEIAAAVLRLRRPGPYALGIVGSGRVGRRVLQGLLSLDSPQSVYLWSRDDRNAATVAGEFAETRRGTSFQPLRTVDAVCREADVVVTTTNAREPIVLGQWLRPGSLTVSAGGGWECDADVYEQADALVVDDWDQCVLMGDLAALVPAGRVQPSDVAATLAEVVVDAARIRKSVRDRIVAVVQGITVLDLAVAARLLAAAESDV